MKLGRVRLAVTHDGGPLRELTCSFHAPGPVAVTQRGLMNCHAEGVFCLRLARYPSWSPHSVNLVTLHFSVYKMPFLRKQ